MFSNLGKINWRCETPEAKIVVVIQRILLSLIYTNCGCQHRNHVVKGSEGQSQLFPL